MAIAWTTETSQQSKEEVRTGCGWRDGEMMTSM